MGETLNHVTPAAFADFALARCLSRVSAACLRFFRYRSRSGSVIPNILASRSLSALVCLANVALDRFSG